MRTLQTVRKDITKIQADIAKVSAALPPQDELISSLREQLSLAKTGFDKFLASASQAVACGTSVELFHDHDQSVKLELALGMAVATRGIDAMLNEVLAASTNYANPNVIRMTMSDKKKELFELRVALYSLSLEEEGALTPNDTRRYDAHPGAVMGIPLEFIKHSFEAV